MSEVHQPEGVKGRLGVIGATRLEIGALKKGIKPVERERVGSSRFFRGDFSGKELVLAESGIGYNNAANVCIHIIERFSPPAILSFGFAGSVDVNAKVGDMLLATHFLRVTDMGILKVEKTHILDEELLDMTSNLLNKFGIEFTVGKAVTVPYFVFKLEERRRIAGELGVKAVEMEGAAVACEAIKHRIPLMALRLISDDLSTREIDYGMVVGAEGRSTLKGSVRFSLAHRRDLLEVFRFGLQLRRLGAKLSEIGARIVEELPLLPGNRVREMDLQRREKRIPCNRFQTNVKETGIS
jgi:adenosylhomocysteine nucleosidase